MKQLESRLAKDSYNSHLPLPRTALLDKSLRKMSAKLPGAQPGHEGNTLFQVQAPDQVVVHPVETCEQCLSNLREVVAQAVERRQVFDLSPKVCWSLSKKPVRTVKARSLAFLLYESYLLAISF